MKKIISIFLMIMFVISIIGCGGRETEVELSPTNDTAISTEAISETSESAITNEQESSSGIQVDEGLLNVTITLPASLFENTPDFDPDTYTEENGFKETVVNQDGSVSITMSKSKHNSLMAEMKTNTDKTLRELIEAENTPYIKAVNSSDGYRTVTVDVDKTGYEVAWDFTPLLIAISVSLYQQFDGVEFHCEVIIRDVETGDTLKSIIYPDAFD